MYETGETHHQHGGQVDCVPSHREPGVNTRLGGAAMEQAGPPGLSPHLYGARGQTEHASKDHTLSLTSERTAWHRFEAKQCRWWLPAAAYVLLRDLPVRGVQNDARGISDDGNHPVALTQTRCPCPSVQGSAEAGVPLVVPRGTDVETRCDVVGGRVHVPVL
jgi:hypothetical protein